MACKDCSICALRLLSKYRLHERTYDNLYLAYKVLCTLSVTQVNCERSFSKLKMIKTRLRSTMEQYRLEATMLMSIEKALLKNLKNESIIDRLAHSSQEMSKLLL